MVSCDISVIILLINIKEEISEKITVCLICHYSVQVVAPNCNNFTNEDEISEKITALYATNLCKQLHQTAQQKYFLLQK